MTGKWLFVSSATFNRICTQRRVHTLIESTTPAKQQHSCVSEYREGFAAISVASGVKAFLSNSPCIASLCRHRAAARVRGFQVYTLSQRKEHKDTLTVEAAECNMLELAGSLPSSLHSIPVSSSCRSLLTVSWNRPYESSLLFPSNCGINWLLVNKRCSGHVQVLLTLSDSSS